MTVYFLLRLKQVRLPHTWRMPHLDLGYCHFTSRLYKYMGLPKVDISKLQNTESIAGMMMLGCQMKDGAPECLRQ